MTFLPTEGDLIPAATVIPLRDAVQPDGTTALEVLMLRKNSKLAFGGMWVFPGGRIDPEDWPSADDPDGPAGPAPAGQDSRRPASPPPGRPSRRPTCSSSPTRWCCSPTGRRPRRWR